MKQLNKVNYYLKIKKIYIKIQLYKKILNIKIKFFNLKNVLILIYNLINKILEINFRIYLISL